MKFNSLQKFLFVVLCHVSFINFGQTETLVTIENETLIDGASQKIGNNFIYTTYLFGDYSLWNLDLNSGVVSVLDSDINGFGQHGFSDLGMFYFSYQYIGLGISGEYTLNYVEPNGNKVELVTILDGSTTHPEYYEPKFPTICNNRYYINGYSNNAHCIWESDGTQTGTQIIYQTQDSIIDIKERNDTLLIITESATDYVFSHYSIGNSVVNFAAVPLLDLSSNFKLIGESHDHFYVNAKDASNQWNITRIDFQNPPEFFIPGYAKQITFEQNRFFIQQHTAYDRYQLVKGDLSNPTQLDTIQFVHSLQTPSTALDQHFVDGYHRIQSIEFGLEIVRLNADDSLELIQPSAFGPGSSVPVNVDGYVYNQLFGYDNFLKSDDGNIYTILTNGNDSDYYVYRINGLAGQSLFRIENPEAVGNFFIHNDFIHWFEFSNETPYIKRRNLSNFIETQPTQNPVTETWFQQFGIGYGWHVYPDLNLHTYLQGVKLDQTGNVIMSFSMAEYMSAIRFVGLDTNRVYQPKGSNVVAKYDKYGKLLWVNGMGSFNGFLLKKNHIALRENGNVVVLGQFYDKGYFDNDSLIIPNAGVFLAELDALSGNVLWKKLLHETIYTNGFEPEGLVLDENENIYFAAAYTNFGLAIDGFNLNSEKSPSNALFKCDPFGEIIWAKDCVTPWLDYFGPTRTLDYSEEFQTITLTQSQGWYTWSSSCAYNDWGNYIQEFDTDGNQMNAFELMGSDLGAITVGTRLPNDRYFGLGYYRGRFEIDNFDLESTMGTNCHKNESFGVLYDGDLETIVGAKTSTNNAFYPLDIAKDGQYVYVFGSDATFELSILKYSNDGTYLGYKKLHQYLSPFGWNSRTFFDVSDDFIVIQGEDFRREQTLHVAPLINSIPSISILKTANSGWINDGTWMQNAPVVYDQVNEILIYPNPFSDYVNVLFSGTEVGFTSYQIVDINGRLVSKGELSEIQFQTISLPHMGQGVYLITFLGNDEKLTKQLIKM